MFFVAMLMACGSEEERTTMPPAGSEQMARAPGAGAVARLRGRDGQDMGVVSFSTEGNGTVIGGQIQGLEPGSTHALHVHEGTSCGDGFKAAGGHLAPRGHAHGGPDAAEHHAGDLGNVEANDDGIAFVDKADETLRIDGPVGVRGHAVIVHAGADDLTSQPSGAAGERIACGIVETQTTAR
jgi:Cu-Zn family superoxide dismutase